MYIERKEYLQKLIDRMGNGMVKIITGIRRCGKSFLLFQLFKDYLLSSGAKEENIIAIALDEEKNQVYTDPSELSRYIASRISDKKAQYFVFLDEVQYAISTEELRSKDKCPRLYGVLNGLLHLGNADVYVTGSNSKLLSSDVMTEFRGRGDEIRVFPLSFSEFFAAKGGDKEAALNEYAVYGGLPQVFQFKSEEDKGSYLKRLFDETYFRDIVERNGIEREDAMAQLVDVLCSSSGSLTNISKLAEAINSANKSKIHDRISNPTVKSYVDFLKDSFLFSEARRYDVRGKRYFDYQSKFYCIDTGLRNARLNFRQIEFTHLMENLIYNRLIQKGFSVDVGMVPVSRRDDSGSLVRSQYEIDFVVNKGMHQYYIQSAFSIDDPEKKSKELYPFSIVNNSFRKIIVTRSEISPFYDDEGFIHVGIADFLLRDDIFSF